MRDKDYIETVGFITRFFGVHDGAVELRACPNVKGALGAESLITRDAKELREFCRRKDVDGIGVYFGTCVRRAGAPSGSADNVTKAPALWVDIDCVKQGLRGQSVIEALEFLPNPPTIIVNSGGGLHAYWMLEEPVDLTEDRERVTEALRALVHILAGDAQCAEVARIMRLPGTMNSKPATKALYDGQPAICQILSDTGAVHDFDALCDWLSEQRVVLHGKVAATRPLNETDPFVRYAREAGYEPSIDVDAELAAMEYESPDDRRKVHPTQLRVSMSMIATGYEDDEIVDRLLAATEAVAPQDQKWNWAAEEKAIRKMIEGGRKLAERTARSPASQTRLPTNGNAAIALVPDVEEAREERPAPKTGQERKNLDQISALGTAVLGVWQERYGPIIHSRGTTYAYEAGVWSVWDDQHDQMLRAMLQEACASNNIAPKTSLLAAATVFFMNRPNLLIRDVEFDQHGLIIAGDGTINLATKKVGEHSPDHRAMFKVGANLNGARDCTTFIKFLEDSFADKDPEEVPHIIRTIQEWFGACLVANKSRALAKGMLVYGGSRTGKTQLSEILRALLGRSQTSATSAADIGTDFGLQGFLGKRGWVADDAIGQDEFLDAERYKKIVTGEEIGVRRKNRTDIMARFGFPVMLTANHLPKIKDQSQAVYNRSLVLPMTCVRPEHLPEPAGYHSIAAKVIAEELSGVLWWALEGWQRLSARGVFTPPPCMTKAVADLQDNNNKVGAWLREAVEADNSVKVATADLFASFAGWYYLENGDGKFPWSQNGFTRKVKEMMPNLGHQAGVKARNLTGLRLTQEGLEYWSINASREARDAPKGASLDQFAVNQDYFTERAERTAEQHKTARSTDGRPRF